MAIACSASKRFGSYKFECPFQQDWYISQNNPGLTAFPSIHGQTRATIQHLMSERHIFSSEKTRKSHLANKDT